MLIAYKYRIYPNKQQEIQIQKTFGCARFVFNHVLGYRIDLYEKENKSMSKFDCNTYCTQILKKEYPWLREVDKFALNNAAFNVDSAYQKFFKEHNGFPKFKSKHNHKKSYKTNNCNNNIEVDENRIKLPKLKWVKAKIHRKFNGKIKSATISQVPSGKYFASILVETEYAPMKHNEGKVGIDLGIKDLVITSDGEKYDNIHSTKRYEDKLAKEQRKLAHKKSGSKNKEKQRIKVARAHEKIANVRKDYLHKISHKLISENQVIVSEDLSISKMLKNEHLSKAISDCGWYELTRQLAYKAKWYDRQYVKIDRYVKSSQTCNVCGCINPNTKILSLREWDCTQCGAHHDRDINAAINILNEGLKLLNVA